MWNLIFLACLLASLLAIHLHDSLKALLDQGFTLPEFFQLGGHDVSSEGKDLFLFEDDFMQARYLSLQVVTIFLVVDSLLLAI